MAFLQYILGWLVEQILKFLLTSAGSAVQAAEVQAKEDADFNKVNDENVKQYEEAKTRLERIKAAKDLLNRTGP